MIEFAPNILSALEAEITARIDAREDEVDSLIGGTCAPDGYVRGALSRVPGLEAIAQGGIFERFSDLQLVEIARATRGPDLLGSMAEMLAEKVEEVVEARGLSARGAVADFRNHWARVSA